MHSIRSCNRTVAPKCSAHNPRAAPQTTARRGILAGLASSPALYWNKLATAQPATGAPSTLLKSGVKFSDVSTGGGEVPQLGDIVMVDVIGKLEDGSVFLDTYQEGNPLGIRIGTYNKTIPRGLSEAMISMRGGTVRSVEVPPSAGYQDQGMELPGGGRVPPGASLYYQVELLRCQDLSIGIACCADAKYPCLGPDSIAAKAAAAAAEGGTTSP